MRRRSCASPDSAWKGHQAEGHVRSALPHRHDGRHAPSCCAVSASTSPSATAPTSILAVRARPSSRWGGAGVGKRRVVGVDAVWNVELELNDPSLDLVPACGDMSSKCGREEGEPFVGHRVRHGRRVAHRSRDRVLIRRHGRRHRTCSACKAAAGLALRYFRRGRWFGGFTAHWLQVLVSNM